MKNMTLSVTDYPDLGSLGKGQEVSLTHQGVVKSIKGDNVTIETSSLEITKGKKQSVYEVLSRIADEMPKQQTRV